MKITKAQTGDGFTIRASEDELRLVGVAVSTFPAAPEERALQRKMAAAVITALPVVEEDGKELEDDDDELFDKEEEDELA